MRPEELKALGVIYFENISQGMQNPERYFWESCRMDKKAACLAAEKKMKDMGPGRAFCDFYYFQLESEAREKILGVLSEKEKRYLSDLKGRSRPGEVIFPLEKDLLSIAAGLNETEMLFSTFYFTGPKEERSTWWGNYRKEYLIFGERKYVRPYVKK